MNGLEHDTQPVMVDMRIITATLNALKQECEMATDYIEPNYLKGVLDTIREIELAITKKNGI